MLIAHLHLLTLELNPINPAAGLQSAHKHCILKQKHPGFDKKLYKVVCVMQSIKDNEM